MTITSGHSDDPPRLPLLVYSSELPGNREDMVAGEIVLRPGEAGYEQAYARASLAYRQLGIAMPYAPGSTEE